jgi:Ca2+/Na+ antiporter
MDKNYKLQRSRIKWEKKINRKGCINCIGGCLFFFFLIICVPIMIWVFKISLFIIVPIIIVLMFLIFLFNICRPSRKTN